MPGLCIDGYFYSTLYKGTSHVLVRLTESEIKIIGELN